MPKAPSNKKVARAARTGGGAVTRGRFPWLWYGSLFTVVVLGTLGVVFSRSQASDPAGADVPPIARQDHWHTAIGFYVCDTFLPDIVSDRDPQGIHTHNDGVIHIHPFTDRAAGRNATLGKYAETVGLELTPGSFKLPGSDEKHETGDKCDGKRAVVKYVYNGREVPGDPNDIRLVDRGLLTVALVPLGVEVPEPASKDKLDNLDDVAPSSTVPGEGPTATITVPAEGDAETGGEGDADTPAPEGGTTGSSSPDTTSAP